jgi:hypothetical protein
MQSNLGWRGRTVLDAEGHRIGRLEEIYLDEATDQPRGAAVRAELVEDELCLVPLKGAKMRADHVTVPVTSGAVDSAPHIDSARELTPAEAASLWRHYEIGSPGAKGRG